MQLNLLWTWIEIQEYDWIKSFLMFAGLEYLHYIQLKIRIRMKQ